MYLIHSQSTVEYTLDRTFFELQLGYMWKVASIVKFWMRYWRKGGQYDLSNEDFRQCRYQVISVFLTSLILLPSMQMFKVRMIFVLCCVPTIIHVVLS